MENLKRLVGDIEKIKDEASRGNALVCIGKEMSDLPYLFKKDCWEIEKEVRLIFSAKDKNCIKAVKKDDDYRVDYYIDKNLDIEEVVLAPLVSNKKAKIQYYKQKGVSKVNETGHKYS